MYTTRPLEPRDINTLSFIHVLEDYFFKKKYFIPLVPEKIFSYQEDILRDLRDLLRTSKAQGFVACKDTEIVGFLILEVKYDIFSRDKFANILWFHSYNNSINKLLLKEYKSLLQREHCSYEIITLCDTENNSKAIAKYSQSNKYTSIMKCFGRRL